MTDQHLTRYLNTDLDLKSPRNLDNLAETLAKAGVSPLQVFQGEDGLHWATFETEMQFAEPAPNIEALLSAIEALSGEAKVDWATCTLREFNLGFEVGSGPWAFNQALSLDLLARMVKVEVGLRWTLYPAADD
ncbi:hypothetical protein [Chitinivorax sp. B]|uniref:hypothetical protein n=1 Tax=Chitinivorax sp. B TaxID=2502235 RepID=UPI0010F759C5|nr:hypothetical protein [Chitinivorax sp. B]